MSEKKVKESRLILKKTEGLINGLEEVEINLQVQIKRIEETLKETKNPDNVLKLNTILSDCKKHLENVQLQLHNTSQEIIDG